MIYILNPGNLLYLQTILAPAFPSVFAFLANDVYLSNLPSHSYKLCHHKNAKLQTLTKIKFLIDTCTSLLFWIFVITRKKNTKCFIDEAFLHFHNWSKFPLPEKFCCILWFYKTSDCDIVIESWQFLKISRLMFLFWKEKLIFWHKHFQDADSHNFHLIVSKKMRKIINVVMFEIVSILLKFILRTFCCNYIWWCKLLLFVKLKFCPRPRHRINSSTYSLLINSLNKPKL